MSLLVKKLGVATVFLLPLFFVSCEDPGKIGLNVDPSQGAVLTKYQEFVLPSSQVQFNPRSTVNSSSFQAGSYTDPDFGVVTSKSYSWLGVQSITPTLNQSAEYDSLTVELRFASLFGSETLDGDIETIELYQLGEPIDYSIDYTNADELILGQKIGSLDLFLQDNDTLYTDSTFVFRLSDSFGLELFNKLKANDGTYENDTTLNDIFNGIAVVPGSNSKKIVQISTSTFILSLAYHEKNVDGEVLTRTYLFNLGNKRFYHIDSNLGGTPLAGIQANNEDFIPTSEYRYLQSGTMIALKLDYNQFFDFAYADSNKDMIIQRALLKVGALEDNQDGTVSPGTLKGYFTNEDNLWPLTSEFTSTADTIDLFVQLQQDLTPPGVYYNSQDIVFGATDTTTYIAQMSTFLQNLSSGGYDSEDTPYEGRGELILFTPTDVDFPQSSSSHVLTNHFKVHKDSIRLGIYYTVPNIN